MLAANRLQRESRTLAQSFLEGLPLAEVGQHGSVHLRRDDAHHVGGLQRWRRRVTMKSSKSWRCAAKS